MSRCFANLWQSDIAFKCLNSEIRHKRNSDDSSDDSSFIQTEKETLTNKTQPKGRVGGLIKIKLRFYTWFAFRWQFAAKSELIDVLFR